ncbi:hypothetical protein J4760_03965 [Salinicoccus sp. ID82-1]|uniref:hypothetical protein n=1 Tax=Salinicoccus sp. ID82-1 TaxID=2820269 RepID=UPI001F46C789|nr:hypothetical protein [Salinicoccus sp. ID82-1]MCG1009207.1 hypothetical protein [Salinicoccus sp. ID82-1]
MIKLYDHKNYGIYKQLRQDIKEEKLSLKDYIFAEIYGSTFIIYSIDLPVTADYEIMTVEDAFTFLKKNA